MKLTDAERAIKIAPKYMRDTADGRASLLAIYRAGMARAIGRLENSTFSTTESGTVSACIALIRAAMEEE